MQIRNILIVLILVAMLSSCSKTLQQRDLSFDVMSLNTSRLPATTFNLGDTTFFRFTGNPDQITFYSGLPGGRYQYVNRTVDSTSAIDTLQFFSSLRRAGSGIQQVLVSTSFTNYTQMNSIDSVAVLASYPSGWLDVTNRVVWASTVGNSYTKTKIPLNDFASAGKPVWLAFRYAAPAGSIQSQWIDSAISLRHYTADTSYVIDSSALITPNSYPTWATSPGWGTVNVTNPAIKYSLNNFSLGPFGVNNPLYSQSSGVSTTTFTINGSTTAAGAVATENWVLSGPINLYQVLPDVGFAVKDMTTNASTSFYTGVGGLANTWANFSIKFTRRGTFNVVFLGYTDTKDKSSQVIKTMTITVQ